MEANATRTEASVSLILSITRLPAMPRGSSLQERFDCTTFFFEKLLSQPGSRPFNHELVIDWAEQQDEPSEEEMSKVKSCYVRNLKESYSEEQIKERRGIFVLSS